MSINFESSKYKLIYVFRINDKRHWDCLKIGEATISEALNSEEVLALRPNASVLNKNAHARINQYTQTAAIEYDLLYTETAVYKKDGRLECFTDHEVHDILTRSGIVKKEFDGDTGQGKEWFITDLETSKKAIKARKEERSSLLSHEISVGQTPISYRPEQLEAIEKTKKHFKKANKMLWYAKMRFGKTLCSMQVVKDVGFKRTLILTHRPVVNAQWFEDYGKIFTKNDGFVYGSRDVGYTLSDLKKASANGKHIIYFASMQYLRIAEAVGGNFDANNEVFTVSWDLIIVDEAHEGTRTDLGKSVMAELLKRGTPKVLELSGTPFNLFEDFKEDEIYTWDYAMEQRAKRDWDITHFGDPNPYAELPRLSIYTYDLGRLLDEYADEDVAFNFREFFRVDESGQFIHKGDILAFLDLLTKTDEESYYPFANDTYREIFRHTLWVLPGVKAAKSLSTLLKSHKVFQHFTIVNVAGDGDKEEENSEALSMVNKAIGKHPEDTRTITLTCGRLTTGVTVKAWTGVLMLSGSYSTAAASYMQTIFRVQSPATINGRVKEDCYAFDFAPDRTLQVFASVSKVSTKAGKTTDEQREALEDLLNFCPIIAKMGGQMQENMTADRLLQYLKRAQAEKVVRTGFEHANIYNDELLKLDDVAVKEFDKLNKIIGKTRAIQTGNININAQGFTTEEYAKNEALKKKKKKDLTDEEKELLEKFKEKKKQQAEAISILRGISIRMPLLIYGADIADEDKELTIDNFTTLVDSQSWEEFMPKGVTKEIFNTFKKYYDTDIFTLAGKRIRAMARAADKFPIEERIARIADIFSTFRNPDKETVLTPWRVVNMHMGDTLGGYCFYDEEYKEWIEEPRYIEHGKVTDEVFATDSYLLEINSKSGLYPLYLTYNIYRRRLKELIISPLTIEEHLKIWDKTVKENIFVICMSPMAKSITRRTLLGFREGAVNTRYFENLINQLKNKPDNFLKKVVKGKTYWNTDNNDENMKFKAVVGNPPYQIMDGGAGASAIPVYNYFVEIAKRIKPYYLSMIMPARWYAGGKGLDEFRKNMLTDKSISILHDYVDCRMCFPNVEIKGGICYLLMDKDWNAECTVFSHSSDNRNETQKSVRFLKDGDDDIFIRDINLLAIKRKIKQFSYTSLATKVSEMKPYGLRGDFFKNQKKYGLPSINVTYKNNDITIWGLDDRQHRVKRFISRDYPLPKRNGLDAYKIFIPRNYGSGMLQDNVFNTIKASPNEICTETFIQIFPFSTYEEMENCDKYLRTKFVRTLIGIRKQDQGAGREVYSFVPLQDFTNNSKDIDWTQSVADIDQQLYKKYGLTKEEQQFIDTMIKPM